MATRGTITFLPSASRTTSSDSGNGIFVGENGEAIVYLDVTAVTGTSPTLDVDIEDTIDGTNYDIVDSFTQATAIGREVLRINKFSRYMRINYTIGGTDPDFTFSVQAYMK